MKNGDKHLTDLRRQAEQKMRARHADPFKVPPDQLHTLIHELEVHQIELEMQNEDLRRAQESLEKVRDRYVDLYDHAPVGYLTVGSSGLIEEANLTACRMFETERATLIGQRLSHFVVAEYQDALYSHHRRLMAGKGPQTFELRLWGGADHRFYAHVKIILLSGPTGTAGAYRIVITDISLRKQTEDDRDQLLRELMQARKWESLGQLAGGIAHDFNNLLGIILGSAELIRSHLDGSEPAKTGWYLEHIRKAGDKAAALVSKMLAFSRGSSGKEKSLQLRSIIQEDLDMLLTLLPSSMRIETELHEQLPDVVVDPTEFSQTLINLCINAQDAMKGKGVLRIGLGWAGKIDTACYICRQQIQGDWIELSVADSGCGIAPDILDNIFDPFFSTKDVGKGTGMGLAVVLGILRRSGGHILLESEPGKGATFRLLFPPSAAATPASEKDDEHAEFMAKGQGEQILILDDQPGLAQVLGEILGTHGYRSTIMTDSREALALVKNKPDLFALVLTGQSMPGITGTELIGFLREIRPDIPVILSTGFSPYVDPESAAGMNITFLQKPVQAKTLVRTVVRLLSATQRDTVNIDRNRLPPSTTTDVPDT